MIFPIIVNRSFLNVLENKIRFVQVEIQIGNFPTNSNDFKCSSLELFLKNGATRNRFPLFNKISPLSKDQIDTNNRENLEISLFLLEKTRRPAPYQNEYSRAFG